MNLNRDELVRGSQERRRYQTGFEIRAADEATTVAFAGWASVTNFEYDVFGGPDAGGWTERVAPGAFRKTLAEKPDVNFLINHDGMTLARTKSGTMRLTEDERGLRVAADLDLRMSPVADLRIAVDRGDVDEMSFGFRVTRDEWTDEDGEPASWSDGTRRTIREINLNHGDVSAVNYGANPATSGTFHAAEQALAELREGREINARQKAVLRALSGEDESQPSTAELIAAHLALREPSESLALLLEHHELLRS